MIKYRPDGKAGWRWRLHRWLKSWKRFSSKSRMIPGTKDWKFGYTYNPLLWSLGLSVYNEIWPEVGFSVGPFDFWLRYFKHDRFTNRTDQEYIDLERDIN